MKNCFGEKHNNNIPNAVFLIFLLVSRIFQSLLPAQASEQENVWRSIMASSKDKTINWKVALMRVDHFIKAMQSLKVPELDLKKSALGVLRLQELYELDTTDLRMGNISEIILLFDHV